MLRDIHADTSAKPCTCSEAINKLKGVCLLVEGRGSRVTSRGSRVNGRGSRVTSRGSKNSSQLFLNVGKSNFVFTRVSGFCFILH